MSEAYSEILERMQTEFEKNAGYIPDDASDISIRMKTLAGEIFSLESSLDFLKRQMFPTTATGEYLDKHAEMRGLKRKPAIKASGKLMFYVERPLSYSFTVPKGTVCAVSDGGLRYVTDEDTVLPVNESFVMVKAHAENGGSEYNIPVNRVTSIVTYFSEAISVNNSSIFGGGASAESDEALRERITESYYNPSNGDNEEYYRRIALGVDGVYSVGIKPLAQGTGTVGIYIAGRASKCSDEVVSALQQEMNDKKGINISVSVENATLTGVVIKLSISVKDGYYADDVKSQVQNEIAEYFRKLCVGDGVKYCELGELIYHIDGVKNYIFDTSVTKEYDGDCTKLYTLGAVSITVV